MGHVVTRLASPELAAGAVRRLRGLRVLHFKMEREVSRRLNLSVLPNGTTFWVHTQKVGPRQGMKIQDVVESPGIIAVFPSDEHDSEAFEARTAEGYPLWIVRRFLNADDEARSLPHSHWPKRRSKFSFRTDTDRVSLEALVVSSPEKLASGRARRERLKEEDTEEGLASLPRDLTSAMEQEGMLSDLAASGSSNSLGGLQDPALGPTGGEPSLTDVLRSLQGLKESFQCELEASQAVVAETMREEMRSVRARMNQLEAEQATHAEEARFSANAAQLMRVARADPNAAPSGSDPLSGYGISSRPATTTARSRAPVFDIAAGGRFEGPHSLESTPLRVSSKAQVFPMTGDRGVPLVSVEARVLELERAVEQAASRDLNRRPRAQRVAAAAQRRDSSGSSDDSEAETTRRSSGMKDTEGLRELARLRRLAPERGVRRWDSMVELGRRKCAASSGVDDIASLRQYFEQCTNLKRFPTSVWFLHVLLGVERNRQALRPEVVCHLTQAQHAVAVERVYHFLSGALALIDQHAWDGGDLVIASRVSLLEPPQPPARPDAPKVKLAADDVLKTHGPLVSERLANTAGVAGGNELDLLEKQTKLKARRKTAGAA